MTYNYTLHAKKYWKCIVFKIVCDKNGNVPSRHKVEVHTIFGRS